MHLQTFVRRSSLTGIFATSLFGLSLLCSVQSSDAKTPPHQPPARTIASDEQGQAEALLIQVLQNISKGEADAALAQAQELVQRWPHFQLGQLVYGDLLMAKTRPIQTLGDLGHPISQEPAQSNINNLREESLKRIKAIKEHPQNGLIPSQFLRIAPGIKHAIAVDASRSRLYLFKNTSAGLEMIADYYISVGKAGTDKYAEGDQRTPLGVYFVTSYLNPKSLRDFYGAGALPINYPNNLDLKRGKTGGGIWLHGTPPSQFARAPRATDGCVVLANPDLLHVINTVETRTTPVLITPEIKWTQPGADRSLTISFEAVLSQWRNAKTGNDIKALMDLYSPDFNSNGKNLSAWRDSLSQEIKANAGRAIELKEISFFHWVDKDEVMVANFDEMVDGQKKGQRKRQYWIKEKDKWKIFFEGSQ